MTRRRTSRPTPADRERLLSSTGGRCAYCGRRIDPDECQLDHVQSLHNHGADDESNLLPACRDCNHLKGACSLEGFRRRVRKTLRRDPSTPYQIRVASSYAGWDGVFFFERTAPDKEPPPQETDFHDHL